MKCELRCVQLLLHLLFKLAVVHPSTKCMAPRSNFATDMIIAFWVSANLTVLKTFFALSKLGQNATINMGQTFGSYTTRFEP